MMIPGMSQRQSGILYTLLNWPLHLDLSSYSLAVGLTVLRLRKLVAIYFSPRDHGRAEGEAADGSVLAGRQTQRKLKRKLTVTEQAVARMAAIR